MKDAKMMPLIRFCEHYGEKKSSKARKASTA
nr:MAG TPA: hypothetical protein [Caudoviricetes sp.]